VRRVVRGQTWDGTADRRETEAEHHERRTTVPVSKAARRRGRTAAEAARRGISVEQLVAERRATAAEDLRLHEEAVRLGITVKELRRRKMRLVALPKTAEANDEVNASPQKMTGSPAR
jgi:hypothetical protein